VTATVKIMAVEQDVLWLLLSRLLLRAETKPPASHLDRTRSSGAI